MGWWSEHVVPRIVDRALSTEDVMKERERACARLSGRVLEPGFGSGLNLDAYPSAVESVSAVEPSDVAWRMSEERRAASPVRITRSGLDGQTLDEPDGSFDAVLLTFTMCTIPDVEQALSEAHRVLRPGGAVVFLEHGLAPDPGVARWQRRLEPVEKALADGCHLTRDAPALLASTGFEVTELDQQYLLGPKVMRPWSFVSSGRAVRA
jgi:ubiquinone/menaquinone biosynthesis C-methylase UbiE